MTSQLVDLAVANSNNTTSLQQRSSGKEGLKWRITGGSHLSGASDRNTKHFVMPPPIPQKWLAVFRGGPANSRHPPSLSGFSPYRGLGLGRGVELAGDLKQAHLLARVCVYVSGHTVSADNAMTPTLSHDAFASDSRPSRSAPGMGKFDAKRSSVQKHFEV